MEPSQQIQGPAEVGSDSRAPGWNEAKMVAGPIDDSDKTDLECPVCCQDYNWGERCPRELECLHTFCTECLVRLDSHQPDCPRCISCPLCRHATALGTPGALALPRQENVLAKLPALEGSATLSRQLILTLDSGETTVVTLPTISLSVEARGTSGQPTSMAHYRLSQKHQTVVCLKKASVRLATLLILICALAFVFAPRLF